MKVLVTGVAGYIGSHVAEELIANGHTVFGIDNLATGFLEFVDKRVKFYRADLRNVIELEKAIREFAEAGGESVIHCAGIKYAGESIKTPLHFYETNVFGTLNLLRIVGQYKIKYFVFSSSCSVYGDPFEQKPISEDSNLLPVSPYGRSKLFAEKIIEDFSKASKVKFLILRYFNVAGNSSQISLDVSEFNLLPNIYRAIENKKAIKIFGDDFATKDGTCIRDYVHVKSLASSHLKSLELLMSDQLHNTVLNLGSGKGYSVKEIVNACKELIYSDLEFEVMPRRDGDPSLILADINKSRQLFGVNPEDNLDKIVTSGWKSWREKKLNVK